MASHVLLSSVAGNMKTYGYGNKTQAAYRIPLYHQPIRASSTSREPRTFRCGRSFLGTEGEVLPTFCSSMVATAGATSIFADTATRAVYIAAAPFSCPVASAASPEAAFVKTAISSHQIVIFSKTSCPYCRRAKAVFKKLNQKPFVIELDEREDGQAIQAALGKIVGKRTVPQVFINGKHIGGSDDTAVAYENGELAKLLGIDVDAKEGR